MIDAWKMKDPYNAKGKRAAEAFLASYNNPIEERRHKSELLIRSYSCFSSWLRVWVLAFVPVLSAVLPGQGRAAVYNLHLATDNVPDYTDLDSFVHSACSHYETPQDKCIAIWRWGRRSRRQTSCAGEDGRLIWDPILHFNSYGAMNCGVISALNVTAFQRLGYKARYIQLGDHTVSEVSWDNGRTWHLFDSSMSFFCFNHDGRVAGCREIQEAHACALSGGRSEPGHYYLYHGAPQCTSHTGPGGWRCAADQPVAYKRTLTNGASSYTDGFSIDRYTLHARHGRRYILNVRPHEAYTRYWKPLDRANPNVAEEDRPDYYRPLKGRDPDEQHGLNNLRANGVWVFQPDLTHDTCRSLLHDYDGIEFRAESGAGENLHPAQAGRLAVVVFKVSAANVITSMRVEADGFRARREDVLRVFVSRHAGIQWTPVWQSQSTGKQKIALRLRDAVAGVTECLVKVEMQASEKRTNVGINAVKLTTLTQINRRTLPKLTLGTNRVRLAADEQVESIVLWPPLHDGRHRLTVHEACDLHSAQEPDGMYKATLGAAVDKQECFAVWRVDAPTDITDVVLGAVATNRSPRSYVSLQYGFDGNEFTEFYRKADGEAPFDQQVVNSVAPSSVPAGARSVYFRSVFFCNGGAATYNMPGIQDLLVRVHHKPRDAGFRPIEVTYNWTEHRRSGDVTRSHTELVESLPHEWAVNVAGFRDPTMNWVRINLEGYGPDTGPTRYGYSDGQDVGAGFEPKVVTYTWGDNLAMGKPYVTSRSSDSGSRNPDEGECELTNGAVIAPTDVVGGSAVQAATAFWAPGDPVTFVVDLERPKRIEGVRVTTHQPNGHYCHPARVDVAVSSDGQAWQEAGTIRHDDLWNPPGDYEPWEHDDSPQYEHLPATGRLAYSFPLAFDNPLPARYVRFTAAPLNGKGMGISELQVFDRVEVRTASRLVAPFPRHR